MNPDVAAKLSDCGDSLGLFWIQFCSLPPRDKGKRQSQDEHQEKEPVHSGKHV
jgi:hypothetical protein